MIRDEVGDLAKAKIKPVTGYRVEINLFSKHNFYVGPGGDLRSGGVFIATPLLPKIGERLRLRIELPFAAIETEAPVEWVREGSPLTRITPGVGASLSHLPDDRQREIQSFFKERAPLSWRPKPA